jgi:8-amino-7-oxononanoate synthase/acyl carrier protein
MGSQTAFAFLNDGESDEISISYAELDRQARAIAAWLQAHGFQGQRAMLLYPPGLEFISAFFGCLYAGVVAVPAYPPRMNRSLARIQAIAADCDARIALTTASVLERVQPQLSQTRGLINVRWRATDHAQEGQEGIEASWEYPELGPGTLAFLQYTSGSTGKPKGVMLTHGNLMHNSGLIDHLFEQSHRTGGAVFWLPSYHDMGLIGGILQPIFMSRPNVLMSPVAFLQRPVRWLDAISRYRANIAGGPNFAYDLCVRKTTPEQREALDLSSWKLAFSGAEPIRAETLDRFVEAFGPAGFRRESFYPCYGLAEATLIVSGGFNNIAPIVRNYESHSLETGVVHPASDDSGRRLVSSGQVPPDQQIVIVDAETLIPCPERKIGEVWVKGPSIAQGYWNRPEETEQVFRGHLADGSNHGPFLRTGDLGFFDGGELFITGRLKDLIIVRGLNHYPQDIELTVEKAHSGVRPSCVAAFAIEDQDSTRVAIIAEIERRQRTELDDILQAIRRDVAREHELLVDFVVLVKQGAIPKTSSGKIQRHACRAALTGGTLEVLAGWETVSADSLAAEEANGETGENYASDSFNGRRGKNGVSRVNGAVRGGSLPLNGNQENGAPIFGPLSNGPYANGNGNGSHTNGNGHSNGHANGHANGNGHKSNGDRSSSAEQRPTDAAGPASSLNKAQAVMAEVRRIGKERAAAVSLDSNIGDLGLDSLERMEILAALEERFGGRFPEDVLPELETCRQVLEAAEVYLGSGAKRERKAPAEVPSANYRFDKLPEYLKLKESLNLLDEVGLTNPFFHLHDSVAGDTTVVSGRELINFSSFNYISMSGDPAVAQAAKDAIDQYGTSVSASRLVSGNKVLHRDLELAIADMIGAEDSIIFVSGHGTNETVIGHLFGPGDLILHDALAHNSIVQGSILSGARRRPFPHNDWRALDRLLTDLRGEYRRVLIAIEGVYSMDGDIPDLPRFIEIKKRHKSFLLIDEAHSVGVLGRRGRGIGEYFDVHPTDVDLWMGTLSKALGSSGGYVAGCKELIEYLKYTAPGFVFSCGIPPSNTAAALAAIQLLEEEPERVANLRDRAKLFLTLAKQRGLNTGTSKDSPVVPIILGNSHLCLAVSQALGKRGVNAMPILHPAVEEKAARLRFFINSNHTEEQIRYTIEVLAEELAKVSPAFRDPTLQIPTALAVVEGEEASGGQEAFHRSSLNAG